MVKHLAAIAAALLAAALLFSAAFVLDKPLPDNWRWNDGP